MWAVAITVRRKVQRCLLLKKFTFIKNQKNNWDLDMINFVLLNMLLLAGLSAKFTAGSNSAMERLASHPGGSRNTSGCSMLQK